MWFIEAKTITHSTERIIFSINLQYKLFADWLEEKTLHSPVYIDVETKVSLWKTSYVPVLKTTNSSISVNIVINQELIVIFPKSLSKRQANIFHRRMTSDILAWLQEEFRGFQLRYKKVR